MGGKGDAKEGKVSKVGRGGSDLGENRRVGKHGNFWLGVKETRNVAGGKKNNATGGTGRRRKKDVEDQKGHGGR